LAFHENVGDFGQGCREKGGVKDTKRIPFREIPRSIKVGEMKGCGRLSRGYKMSAEEGKIVVTEKNRFFRERRGPARGFDLPE